MSEKKSTAYWPKVFAEAEKTQTGKEAREGREIFPSFMIVEFITILYRAIFGTSAWAFFLAGLIIRQGATDYSPAMMIGLALYGIGVFIANRSVDRQLGEIDNG